MLTYFWEVLRTSTLGQGESFGNTVRKRRLKTLSFMCGWHGFCLIVYPGDNALGGWWSSVSEPPDVADFTAGGSLTLDHQPPDS